MSSNSKIPLFISKASYYHKQGITGKGITVAFLDSGIALHKDFQNNSILFRNFVTGQKRPYDDYSHGTHIAGILASDTLGIAPDINIVALKVLDKYGNCSIPRFTEGIQWILAHKQQYDIRIVNISLGGQPPPRQEDSQSLIQWVAKLWDAGLIVCCSAGNNGPKPNTITAPGTCKKIITVGASDGEHFSSAGIPLPYISKPEILAPGNGIKSTLPQNRYGPKSGTSMSTAFISAYCALLLQLNGGLTNDSVKIRLMHAARPIPGRPYHMQGAGSVSLEAFLSPEFTQMTPVTN